MTQAQKSNDDARPLAAAVVGLAAAPPELLDALAGGGRFALRAVADADRSLADEVAAARGVPGYVDARRMLAEVQAAGKLDAVFLAVPQAEAPAAMALALERRVHVCKLSPVAANFEQAAEWVTRFAGEGLALSLARPWRWHRSFAALARWREQLGGLLLIEGRSIRPHADPLGWRRQCDLAGGGVLLAEGRPLVDLTVLLAGLPDAVSAITGRSPARSRGLPLEVEDTALLLVRYDGGAIGTLTSSWATGPAERRFVVHGSNAVAEADLAGATLVGVGGERLARRRASAEARRQAWRATTDNFAATLAGAGPPPPDPAILANMAVIEAAYLSARTNAPESPAGVFEMHNLPVGPQ